MIGVASITTIATTTPTVPLEDIGEAYGEFCDRAALFGADVHLEFLPMTYVPDLATAWRLVQIADSPNGGILFDTWHFYRGDPDFGLLATIPGHRILAVQVNDAAEEVVGTLWEDTMRRLLPGDGSFDVARAMAALGRIGGLSWIGPEVFSEALIAMGPDAAARLARERVEATLP